MYNEEPEQPRHLVDYYHVITSHKWAIIVSLIVMVSLVLWHNSHLIPIYRATTTLIIDKEITKSPLTGNRMDYETYLSESLTFNTHFKLITSRQVLERVVRNLKLDSKAGGKEKREVGMIHPFRQYLAQFKENISLLIGKKDESPLPKDRLTDLVQSLKAMVNIEQIEDTRLLLLEVSHPDPVMARDLANAVAQAYIKFNIDNRLKSSQNTLSWLADNLYEMKKNLEDAEEEFSAFKQKAKLISIEKSQELVAQKMRDFNDAYIRSRNRRLELDAKLAELRRAVQSGGDILYARSLIQNPLIENLHTQLLSSEGELSRINKVFKSKHPKIIQIKAKIADIRENLREEIKKEKDNLQSERSVLLAKEKVLQTTIADFEKEAMEIGSKELNHNILKRNVEMNERLYDTILSRLKEADVTGSIDVSNIRIVEKAILPRVPVGPNKKRNFMLAVVIGLMIGVGLSFLREYLDRSLHTEEDVQSYLGLPVLSVIPKAENKIAKGKGHKA